MIAPNESEQEHVELTPKQWNIVLHLLLLRVKIISIPKEVLDHYPIEKQKVCLRYDDDQKMVHIFTPKKRKRGIIKPDRRLILPG